MPSHLRRVSEKLHDEYYVDLTENHSNKKVVHPQGGLQSFQHALPQKAGPTWIGSLAAKNSGCNLEGSVPAPPVVVAKCFALVGLRGTRFDDQPVLKSMVVQVDSRNRLPHTQLLFPPAFAVGRSLTPLQCHARAVGRDTDIPLLSHYTSKSSCLLEHSTTMQSWLCCLANKVTNLWTAPVLPSRTCAPDKCIGHSACTSTMRKSYSRIASTNATLKMTEMSVGHHLCRHVAMLWNGTPLKSECFPISLMCAGFSKV